MAPDIFDYMNYLDLYINNWLGYETNLGAVQVLRNVMVVGGCQLSRKKALRRCKVQRC